MKDPLTREKATTASKIKETRVTDWAWAKIFLRYNIYNHDFDSFPFTITSKYIKEALKALTPNVERKVRVLCKQDTRESRPRVFQERGLFILPTRNGVYSIIKGEGYIDIPPIPTSNKVYTSQLDFPLDTAKVGNSEMQHLDYAYASSLIRTFLNDPSLVLTIRGRKYTPGFTFNVGRHHISVASVQTEVDAGYEGRNQVALIEAKATGNKNTIIRQLFYPFRQWQSFTKKRVVTVLFEKVGNDYSLWEFQFADTNNYNSITLTRAQRFTIQERA